MARLGTGLFDEPKADPARMDEQTKDELRRCMREAQKPADPSGYFQKQVYFQVGLVIDSLDTTDNSELFLEYQVVLDTEWSLLEGRHTGCTQETTRLSHSSHQVVFGLPVDLLLRANKISTMPTVMFILKGYDFLGRHVVKAYGSVHLPLQPGHHSLSLCMFRPVAFGFWAQWADWLKGSSKEFNRLDYSLAQGQGRELTRVEPVGHLKLKVEVLSRNVEWLGYQTGRP